MRSYPYPCELYQAGCIYTLCNGMADVPEIAIPKDDDTIVYRPRCYKLQPPQFLSEISEEDFARAKRGEFEHHSKTLLDIKVENTPPAKMSALTSPQPPDPVTKSDLRAAVKTILRGEDVSAAKPGPRITAAKQRQIEAAEAYRKSHAGCTLHNACMRSFVPAKGGYKSAAALYSHMHDDEKS